MYAFIYQVIQNNGVAEMRVKLYEDWRRAVKIMQDEYEDRLWRVDGREFEYKGTVSCTIKTKDTTYDWSIIML